MELNRTKIRHPSIHPSIHPSFLPSFLPFLLGSYVNNLPPCKISIAFYITTLHYITLHYITLHYITLHYITLHYITLHCIALHYIALHSRPIGSGGAGGGFSPPNNLLKFADFESEKGCKSQGRKNEDSNFYIFEETTRIYQKCNIF